MVNSYNDRDGWRVSWSIGQLHKAEYFAMREQAYSFKNDLFEANHNGPYRYENIVVTGPNCDYAIVPKEQN